MKKGKTMSQVNEVLSYLKKGKCLTSYQAFEMFGATRLSAIIFVLRERGYKIGGIWEETVDRYGKKKRFIRYFLIKGKENGKNKNNR